MLFRAGYNCRYTEVAGATHAWTGLVLSLQRIITAYIATKLCAIAYYFELAR